MAAWGVWGGHGGGGDGRGCASGKPPTKLPGYEVRWEGRGAECSVSSALGVGLELASGLFFPVNESALKDSMKLRARFSALSFREVILGYRGGIY